MNFFTSKKVNIQFELGESLLDKNTITMRYCDVLFISMYQQKQLLNASEEELESLRGRVQRNPEAVKAGLRG